RPAARIGGVLVPAALLGPELVQTRHLVEPESPLEQQGAADLPVAAVLLAGLRHRAVRPVLLGLLFVFHRLVGVGGSVSRFLGGVVRLLPSPGFGVEAILVTAGLTTGVSGDSGHLVE